MIKLHWRLRDALKQINSVPSLIITECVIDKKQYLDNMEFLSACNRLYNCLRNKKK